MKTICFKYPARRKVFDLLTSLTINKDRRLKWSCFFGQVCGLAKMYLFYVHAAFRISACSKYAASGVRLSRAV